MLDICLINVFPASAGNSNVQKQNWENNLLKSYDLLILVFFINIYQPNKARNRCLWLHSGEGYFDLSGARVHQRRNS